MLAIYFIVKNIFEEPKSRFRAKSSKGRRKPYFSRKLAWRCASEGWCCSSDQCCASASFNQCKIHRRYALVSVHCPLAKKVPKSLQFTLNSPKRYISLLQLSFHWSWAKFGLLHVFFMTFASWKSNPSLPSYIFISLQNLHSITTEYKL